MNQDVIVSVGISTNRMKWFLLLHIHRRIEIEIVAKELTEWTSVGQAKPEIKSNESKTT